MRIGLKMMDLFLHVIHLALVVICLLGWMFEPTRVLHLVTVGLVAVSWLGLGMFRGWGYCLLTDTQWRIKKKLGQEPQTDSYIKYMLDKVMHRDINQEITDNLTLYLYIGVALLSVVVNFWI